MSLLPYVAGFLGLIAMLEFGYICMLLIYIRSREVHRPQHLGKPSPEPEYQCAATDCNERFVDERAAISHAKIDHGAPDDQNARFIVEGVK